MRPTVLTAKQLREYVPGAGCRCAAWNSSECACPKVDWTPTEIYELRLSQRELRRQIQNLKKFEAASKRANLIVGQPHNHAQRISILETELSDVLGLLRETAKLIDKQQRADAEMLRFMAALDDDQTAMMRLIGSSSIFGDAKINEKFLAFVARRELHSDQLQARVRDFLSKQTPIPPAPESPTT